MGLPSKRRTSRSKKERHAHIQASSRMIGVCPNCSSAVLPHHACPKCGTYRGRKTVNVEKRATRTLKRAKRA